MEMRPPEKMHVLQELCVEFNSNNIIRRISENESNLQKMNGLKPLKKN